MTERFHTPRSYAELMADMSQPGPWWLCPNTPRCPHAGALHDIEDFDDEKPRCCVDGCTCGTEEGATP